MSITFTDRNIPIRQALAAMLSATMAAAAEPLADLGQMYLAGRCREFADRLSGERDLLIDLCDAIALSVLFDRAAAHLGDHAELRQLAAQCGSASKALRGIYLTPSPQPLSHEKGEGQNASLLPTVGEGPGMRGDERRSGLAAAIQADGNAGAPEMEAIHA